MNSFRIPGIHEKGTSYIHSANLLSTKALTGFWGCHPLSAVANAVIWLLVCCQVIGTWGAQKKCFHFFVWPQLYKLCSSPATAFDNLHMCLGSRSFTAWIQVPGCSEKENHFFNTARSCGRNYIIPQPSWMVCCIQHEYLSFIWYYWDDSTLVWLLSNINFLYFNVSAQWVCLKLTQYNDENKWQKGADWTQEMSIFLIEHFSIDFWYFLSHIANKRSEHRFRATEIK